MRRDLQKTKLDGSTGYVITSCDTSRFYKLMKQHIIYLHASGIFKLALSIKRFFCYMKMHFPIYQKNKEHEDRFLFRYVNH